MPAPQPTEPEAHWIYPLGGRPDTRLKAEVEGRLLQEVHAVWSPEPDLKGAILEVRPVSEQEKGSEKSGYGDKKKAPNQRVNLELEIGPGVPSGVHSLYLVSRRGISNPLSFLVSSDPVMEESEDRPSSGHPQRQALPRRGSGQLRAGGDGRGRPCFSVVQPGRNLQADTQAPQGGGKLAARRQTGRAGVQPQGKLQALAGQALAPSLRP